MSASSKALTLQSGLVVRSPFDAALMPVYREAHGEVDITWTPTTVLMKNIENGLTGDVIIVTDQAMDELIAKGVVDAESCKKLIVSRIGFAVKQGEAKPDVSTPQALAQTLLDTRSVCYSIGGASGIHFKTVLARLGIEEEVDANACPIPEGFTAEKLITGEASLAVQQISELLVVSGIEIVGRLPEELQKVTSFTIGLYSQSQQKDKGAALIEIVTSEASKEAYARFGLDCRF